MASHRIRVPLTGVDAGRNTAVTITQTAGSTAGFLDVFVDSVDVPSMAVLERALIMAHEEGRHRYRQSVGGV